MVRHGQSLSNIEETFTGTINSPLSELGLAQARLCAEYLKTKNPDRLFSSDLDRAYMTAFSLGSLICKPIEKLNGLREIDGGRWQGLKFDEIEKRFPESYKIWRYSMDEAVCDGGESVASLQKRVTDSLFLISKECDGQTVCVFTHATPIRTAAAFAKKQTIQETPWPANSSVSEFVCDNGELTLKSYGYNDFLGESITFLPENV